MQAPILRLDRWFRAAHGRTPANDLYCSARRLVAASCHFGQPKFRPRALDFWTDFEQAAQDRLNQQIVRLVLKTFWSKCKRMFPRREGERIAAKTGTTTVGLKVKGGVVFATDTRVTSGYYIAHRKGKKLFPLADHMAITIAGRVADAQSMIDLLRANINYYQLSNNTIMGVGAASRLAANVFFANRPNPLVAQVIIGGVDPLGSHLFNIDYTGTMTEEKIISTGSGSPVAYGTIESGYREDLEVTEAIALAAKAVATAIRRNAGTGDSIDIAIIDSGMKYRELTLGEKKKYLQHLFPPLT